MNPIKVFISYSHDSLEHSARVLELADSLRSHGIDAELDRYHVRPPKGWPHWCEEQLRPENSSYVLMICTRTYLQRIQDKVPANEGRGVFWEGAIIYEYVYSQKENTRFIPVLFADGTETLIPIPLRNHTRYQIGNCDFTDPGYQGLYRELTGQPSVTKPSLGEIIDLESGVSASITAVAPRSVQSDFHPPVIQASSRGLILISLLCMVGIPFMTANMILQRMSSRTADSISDSELEEMLKGNHQQIRLRLDALGIGAEDPAKFEKVRQEIERRLDSITEANAKKQLIRFREESKSLVDYLNTPEVKAVVPIDVLEKFKFWCNETPKPDPIRDHLEGRA